jgi:hypothetical protein
MADVKTVPDRQPGGELPFVFSGCTRRIHPVRMKIIQPGVAARRLRRGNNSHHQ